MLQLRITGITKMKDERICMSGYDQISNIYYRPILRDNYLTSSFLYQGNAKINLFSLVTFQKLNEEINTSRPHQEDVYISSEVIDIQNDLKTYQEKKQFLYEIADKSIEEVFGDFIEIHNNSPVVLLGCGYRSLGTIIARECHSYYNSNGDLRVDITDSKGYCLENIKCVALYNNYFKEGLFQNIPIRISLTREWKKPGDQQAFYWIQVSDIFP